MIATEGNSVFCGPETSVVEGAKNILFPEDHRPKEIKKGGGGTRNPFNSLFFILRTETFYYSLAGIAFRMAGGIFLPVYSQNVHRSELFSGGS